MKCPYRPITTTSKISIHGNSITTTEFAECYYRDCPWYKPETPINKYLVSFETCQRCHTENAKVMNECDDRKR